MRAGRNAAAFPLGIGPGVIPADAMLGSPGGISRKDDQTFKCGNKIDQDGIEKLVSKAIRNVAAHGLGGRCRAGLAGAHPTSQLISVFRTLPD